MFLFLLILFNIESCKMLIKLGVNWRIGGVYQNEHSKKVRGGACEYRAIRAYHAGDRVPSETLAIAQEDLPLVHKAFSAKRILIAKAERC